MGQDLNANLYIGEFASGDIRKLTCNGTLLPESQYVVPFSSGLNIGSTSEGVLYTNPNGTSYPDNAIAAFDICSGTNLGYVLLGGYTDRDWGMFVAPDGTIYSTQADDPWPNSEPKWIWRYKPTSADLIAHTVYAPFVDIDAAVVPLGIDNTSFQIMGITVDNVGNMYVVAWDFETTGSRRTWILKFNSLGTLVDSAFEDEDANTIGYDGSFGIVYDATLNRLYLSGLDDCIAIVDTDLNYVGTGIGHVPSSTPKGIAMARECCPPSVTTTLDTLICASIGDKLFLSQLTTTCDGPICGGTWTPSGSNVGITFNACDNSIIINNPDIACGTFTLSSVGGANTTCGTFTYILNINVGRITGPSISGSQLLCPIDVPAQLTSSGGTDLNH
ncbi:MAG: hypothetical protein IPH96_02760 [Saprospiraceae bacterium]|nr:hypothetical protein [Saprospiraceae bacterium]